MNNEMKLSVLWIFNLICLLLHQSLEMMPLFVGKSIATGHVMPEDLYSMIWVWLICFLLPMSMTLTLHVFKHHWIRIVNFILAIFYFIFSIAHLGEHLLEGEKSYYQIVLLAFMVVNSFVLTLFSKRSVNKHVDE